MQRWGVVLLAGCGVILVAIIFITRGGPADVQAQDEPLKPLGKQTQQTEVAEGFTWHTMWVTATAYNSLASQTDKTPNLAAWGDTLEPGMKAVAVSRDLIPLGLEHNTKVYIDDEQAPYLVLDKMNKRWRDRIDIYMGVDRTAALQWGKKRVRIRWQAPSPVSSPVSSPAFSKVPSQE